MQGISRQIVGPLAWLALIAASGMGIGTGMAQEADEPPEHPHPVLVWPAGPFEARVAFDRPLDASLVKTLAGRVIPFEEDAPGDPPGRRDRDEIDPDHQGTLRIAAARLADEGRTLCLITDPHPRAARYSLHLSGIRGPGQPATGEAIDLRYQLRGVEAAWDEGKDDGTEPFWTSWWPELDPAAVSRLARGSAEHERTLAFLARPGRLALSTLLMLPEGRYTLRLVSSGPIEAMVNGENAPAADTPEGGQRAEFPIETHGEPIDLWVSLRTGVGIGAEARPPALQASLVLEGEGRERRVSSHQLLLPWASTVPSPPAESPGLPQNLTGGDPARGESVFFGEQARCSACHAFGGKGGKVGPDLGHQFERSPAEVFRDLADPGAWIDPDYVAYTVALEDGRVLVGIVRTEGADSIRVTDTDAKTTVVRRDEIEEFRPSPTSIMPVGLAGALGDGALKDLLAFLTRAPGASQ